MFYTLYKTANLSCEEYAYFWYDNETESISYYIPLKSIEGSIEEFLMSIAESDSLRGAINRLDVALLYGNDMSLPYSLARDE